MTTAGRHARQFHDGLLMDLLRPELAAERAEFPDWPAPEFP